MTRPNRPSTITLVTAVATVAGTCIAGVALVVTLVTGATLGGGGGGEPTGPAGRGDPSAGSSPAPAAEAPVLWEGTVLLDGTPVEFDAEPPRRGNTSTDLSSDAVVNGSTYMGWFGGRLALWRATAEPKRDDCVALIDTRGVKEVPIDAKSRFCLRTNGGRFAYIEVVARSGDGYDAEVTLWSSG